MNDEKTNGSLLGDLTFTQVVAGAAASAASFALAKQTGILGSVIGAAIGSVAATIAGQVFTSMLDRSVEGIRSIETQGDSTVQLQPQHAEQAQAPKHRTLKRAAIALALTAAAGLAAVWVYSVGVDIFTEGQGIGTQAPVIEYVMAPQDYASAPEETTEDEAASAEESQPAETEAETTTGTEGTAPADGTETLPSETDAAATEGATPTDSSSPATPTAPVSSTDTAAAVPVTATTSETSSSAREGASAQG